MTRAALLDVLDSLLYRDGAAEGRAAGAARAAPRAAQCRRGRSSTRSRSTCRRCWAASIIVEVIFSYPGLAKLAVDACRDARHAAGAGLRHDLLRDLHAAGAGRRHRSILSNPRLRHPMSDTAAISSPRRRRLSVASQAGIGLVLAWAALAAFGPYLAPYRCGRRGQCRRVRADELPPIRSAPTISAATC